MVNRSPKVKVLGGKWVFKLKRDQDVNYYQAKRSLHLIISIKG